jgi:outer membrane murein-binding lipoprotein Lpp
MNTKKIIRMEDHSLLMVITSLVGALGLKSVWDIIKKKMDISAAKDERVDNLSLSVIEELKDKIGALELKIDALITENTALREKLARMEERLVLNAKKSAGRKRTNG